MLTKKWISLANFFAALLVATGVSPDSANGQVAPVPDSIRSSFRLDDFYQKHTAIGGLPVVGSEHVSDAELKEYDPPLAALCEQV